MLLDRRDFLVAEGGTAIVAEAERAEAAVALVAARAPGDLRHLGYAQSAIAAAVELLEPGEGDMGHVHVEAHADGVGGDEIIDLAALEHGDLGVAGRGRQRAHHHRRTAAEPAQHLGQRVNLLGGEGDDGGARRKARQLDVAGVAQGRKARAADDLRLGKQLADDRLQRIRAEDQRFLAAARAKHSVGEDVAALGVDAELGLVDRRERELIGERAFGWTVVPPGPNRHRFRRAEDVARVGRDDPLLAGQQRDLLLALQGDHPLVDLAREQAQREADHARGMGAHPFDGEIGLAGVGRTEDGPNRSVRTARHIPECGSAPPNRKLPSTDRSFLNGR